ncbi:MAG TPA: heme biosynthesis HemY N-terminal domain-containing protein [Caulobacterales bacterium]|nr:heme biosynthesis HemY N-terminal domain-containing protein [Caulobacterales bacterium]
MIRIAFLLVICIAVALAMWALIPDPGTVQAEWHGWKIETTVLFGIIVFAAYHVVALPLLRLLTFLFDAPEFIGRQSKRAKLRRGHEAMALGLIAAEAGEFEEARKQANKAEDLIEEPRLALLLQARAAEVGGDYAAAERAYSGMLQNEDTEILGRKGLMLAALKRGDRTAAMAHADAALKVSKSAAWPFQYAFDLKVQAADWEGAIDALDIGDKRKQIDDKVAKRRRAVLMAAAAQRLERERHPDKAAEMAQKAFRMSPGFAPAAALASRLLVAEGKNERAAAILEEAWENAPHPAIAHAYRDLNPGETREARAQRMAGLADKRRDSRESKIVLAELAIERGDWGAAQPPLEDAYRELPSSRVCTLFAQVARGRGDENGVRNWLAQAATAPREADWSDLDPEGPAFLYDDSDWARLVYVYGDGGQLIHPRMERGHVDAPGSVLALPAAALAPPSARREEEPEIAAVAR